MIKLGHNWRQMNVEKGTGTKNKITSSPCMLYQRIHPRKRQFNIAYTKILVQTLWQLESFFYWLIHKRSNMSSFSPPCMAHLASKNISQVVQSKVSPVFVDNGDLFKTFLNNFLQQKPEFFYSPYQQSTFLLMFHLRIWLHISMSR